ncbi:MAG TPA: dockerin type I domain-containing protein [Bryobacteraceae bacterium]
MIRIGKNSIGLSLLLFTPAAWAQFNCTPSGSEIFQQYSITVSNGQITGCTFTAVNPDLQQLESDMVNAWLAFHQLPASDSSIIYQYGRVDLRNQIRAMMFTELERIALKDASTRTPHEQAIYDYFANWIQQLDSALVSAAARDAQSWFNDPCSWRPDPNIAAQTGITYNPIAYCSGSSLVTAFSAGPPVPSTDYFNTAALNHTYGHAVTMGTSPLGALPANLQVQNFGPQAVNSLAQDNQLVLAYGTPIAASLAGAASLATYTFIESLSATVAGGTQGFITAATTAASSASRAAVKAMYTQYAPKGQALQTVESAAVESEAISEEAAAEAISNITFDFAAAPVAVILLAAEIGIEAGIQFFDYNQAVSEVQDLVNAAKAPTPVPDLASYLNDSTGLYKVQMAFIAQTMPEAPSTQPLPQHRPGTDAVFIIHPPNNAPQVISDTLTYTDIAGTTWNIQTYGGWFVKSGKTIDGNAVTSISPTLNVMDPNGITWMIDRVGDSFLWAKTQPASTDIACPAQPLSNYSDSALVNQGVCSSWIGPSFWLQDGTMVSLGQKPVFEGNGFVAVSAGQNFTANVLTLASPPANLQASGLPPGVTFKQVTYGVGQLSGTAPGTGTYTFRITATNPGGTATQTITMVSNTQVQIVTPSTFNFPLAAPTIFTIRATGSPAPKFTLRPGPCTSAVCSLPMLPAGITFKDNGDGTATLSGIAAWIPSSGVFVNGKFYASLPAVIVTASNGFSQATQTLQINPVPISATLNGPFQTTFTAGVINPNQNTFTTSSGVPPCTPSSSSSEQNGTITITVQTCLYVPAGGAQGVTYQLVNNGNIPPWLRFHDNGDGTATFHGAPPPSASNYDVPVTVLVSAAGVEPANYLFTIHVSALPQFQDSQSHRSMRCDIAESCPPLPVTTNMAAGAGNFSLSGTVPSGVKLNSRAGGSNAELDFSGKTGGAYLTSVTATDSVGSTTATYAFYISQRPAFPTFSNPFGTPLWLMEGVPVSISFPTTGFPHDLGVTDAYGKQVFPPMTITTQEKPPAGLSFTDTTPGGVPTGTGVLSGTPAPGTAGHHEIVIVANNGGHTDLGIEMRIRKPGDVDENGSVNCQDFTIVKSSFGRYNGQTGFDARADLNNDGVVNDRDLAILAAHFPEMNICR